MRFAVSCGDVAGIGPEIIVKSVSYLLTKHPQYKFIITIPSTIHDEIYRTCGANYIYSTELASDARVIIHDPWRSVKSSILGKPSKKNGRIAYRSILDSFQFCRDRVCDAIVTAPISKVSFDLGGVNYPGHTELLADLDGTDSFGMFFLSKQMKAVLYTIHTPLNKVPSLIKKEKLVRFFRFIETICKTDFGIISPKIAVLGLNPHAGESGLIGREELNEITPAVQSAGGSFHGVFVPDAFFGKKLFKKFDLVAAMYHDQALIPFKLMSYEDGVNFTAGLKIIRTSPDHGTAFDIAGKNIADPSSMISSFNWAARIKRNRERQNAKS